ncbi:MAG TPA: HepT-like ribonuclease domain-containing protein [Actinophytocola sp.]|jgi:uncharacterized protein with HEPN domain|uniref:HepT-like ribonuclease domain-containing protein n=1 Tax=Actinophytocola sp. TaxID=1872138 RepID=UPI002E01AF2F|nr:HepT-like ribonuclease domain-containing protein [Actinophytocola sp.]
MPRLDDAIRIQYLIAAAEKAAAFAAGRDRAALDEHELLRLGLVKLVEIIGEAAKQVSEPTRLAHPAVPWSAAARMRDRLVHHYFDINLDVLWATVTVELPKLLDLVPRPDADL